MNFKTLFYGLIILIGISLASCSDDSSTAPTTAGGGNNFEGLESPYLICAGRNPGGIGFDFEYKSAVGGAYNIDANEIADLAADMIIKTVKSEKPDGTLCGMPYIALNNGAKLYAIAL